ncbi:PepSY-associated TM helix domain-containing protein [Aliarcobacter butzleri]|uniref:PepSY-associated TM helix domain-containing protein n=1 Tax=Aliarcobacter butzleri TaxID=28197 RepID=UPI0021B533CE|nr:PepSY-associated TM helix domain-containing protein [Aliarcobacter butzleri]MCT7636460.1 PepSY domain-containing protein [Aliarcobacter butzleri]
MHKKIWFKIHWILGVVAGVFLLLIGVSGAILSFQKEITKFINQDSFYITVPENKARLSTTELLNNFQTKFPEAKISGITFSSDVESSSIISVESKDKNARGGKRYYVNPYDGEILPDVKGNEFFTFIRMFHRWFALEGDLRAIGKQVVAISTICLIILSITGLIIYWPRVKRSFFKSFTFSFKHNGRAFLSTMHSAVGMWVLIFYLLASLTGLYWSYDWYNTMLYKIAGVEKPVRNQQQPNQQNMQKMQAEKSQNNTAQKEQKTQTDRVQNSENQVREMPKVNFEDYEKAVLLFNNFVQRAYTNASVTFPQKGTVYKFTYLDENAIHFREINSLEVDISTQKMVKHDRFENLGLNEQLLKSIFPLHSGEYFGIIGQTLMFISCLLMILFTVTGYMLYINRHKKKNSKTQKIKS